MATTAKPRPAVAAVLTAAARLRHVTAEADKYGTVTLTYKGRARLSFPYEAIVNVGPVTANGTVVGRLSLPTLTFASRNGRRTQFLGRTDALANLVLMNL